MVDISGLNKADVLAALYNNAKPLGWGNLQFDPKPLTGDEVMTLYREEYIEGKRFYVDYLKGRVIKVDLTDYQFDPRLYDRDNGEGEAQRVIDKLRAAIATARNA